MCYILIALCKLSVFQKHIASLCFVMHIYGLPTYSHFIVLHTGTVPHAKLTLLQLSVRHLPRDFAKLLVVEEAKYHSTS